MYLNAKQILALNIIQMNGMGKEAQVGIDLTIKAISQIQNGIIMKDSAKILPYKEVESDFYQLNHEDPTQETEAWILAPGVYSLTFHQGVKLDTKHNGRVIHRSSILRSGAQITSGIFDPGFECDELGGTMFVHNPITIEKGARIAQFMVSENYESEAYNGNYQSTKDLK